LIAETNKHVNPVDATSGRFRASAMAGWSTKYHGKSAAYSPCSGERSAGLESPILGPVTDLVKCTPDRTYALLNRVYRQRRGITRISDQIGTPGWMVHSNDALRRSLANRGR
jgi:hypothetical protein